MSLQMSPMALIPAETAWVARAAFSKGTLCLQDPRYARPSL